MLQSRLSCPEVALNYFFCPRRKCAEFIDCLSVNMRFKLLNCNIWFKSLSMMASTTQNTLGIWLFLFLQTLIQTKDGVLDSALDILLVIHHHSMSWSFIRPIQTNFTIILVWLVTTPDSSRQHGNEIKIEQMSTAWSEYTFLLDS